MSQTDHHHHRGRKWAMFALRWGIAVVGVYLVVVNIAFRDRVILVDSASNRLDEIRVLGTAKDEDAAVQVVEPDGSVRTVTRDQLWAKSYRARDTIADGGKGREVKVLAVHPPPTDPKGPPQELLVQDQKTKAVERIPPSRLADAGDYLKNYVAYPLVEVGLNRMVREADWRYLVLALLVMPMTYLLTSYRWHLLLEALDIHIGTPRTFVINMVGAFYNSFMPGSTGGDLLRGYYAAKHTTHRTRAILSVIVDRVIGLLALIILGGFMASLPSV